MAEQGCYVLSQNVPDENSQPLTHAKAQRQLSALMREAVVQLQKPMFGQVLDFLGCDMATRETPTAAVVTGSVADHLSVFGSLVRYIRTTPMRDSRMLRHIAVLQSVSCQSLQATLNSLVQQFVTADLPEVTPFRLSFFSALCPERQSCRGV